MATLKWNGRAIQRQVTRAAVKAVDETMDATVDEIRQRHPWQDQSGELTRSIEVLQPATREGSRVEGVLGSRLWYSGFVEASHGGPMRQARDRQAEALPARMRRHFKGKAAV